jgi:hypothetical protein
MIKYIWRILSLPFVLFIFIIFFIRILLIRAKEYLMYGGEQIVYNEFLNRKSLFSISQQNDELLMEIREWRKSMDNEGQ